MTARPIVGVSHQPPFLALDMKAPSVSVDRRSDGAIILRSQHRPSAAPRSIAHLLLQRALVHPDRPFIKQRLRQGGPWRQITYGETLHAAEAIGERLLDLGATPSNGVLVLSGNSIEHALLILASHTAGIVVTSVSPSYSLNSTDHLRLAHCARIVQPRIVFAQNARAFARAFDSLRELRSDLCFAAVDEVGHGVIPFHVLAAARPSAAIKAARETVRAQTIAKYMFTSGSTGLPKAVPQTHGMLCAVIASLEGLRTARSEPDLGPESLEWMPWSHIAAGNLNFNANLWNGGTIYLDEGRPSPGRFDITIENLREISPVVFGSAPIAYPMLVAALQKDDALRRSFFKNLKYMRYGGAAMSNDIQQHIQALAVATTGRRIPLLTMYGATETQAIAGTYWGTEQLGLIGLPLPGAVLKLVPCRNKLEVRAKGPTITSGYLKDPERTAAAFDDEGYFRTGDAARFADESEPVKGLVFDGRISEDFKLSSGTWVSTGVLRRELIAACAPYIADVLIAGEGREMVTALLWPAAQFVSSRETDAPLAWLELKIRLSERLIAFNAQALGSSRRIARFLLLPDLPSAKHGEINDKGYVNQHLVLQRRSDLVASLYADPPGEEVVTL